MSFAVDLQASGGPRDTPPWACLPLPKCSQWKAFQHQASGLHGGVVPWQAPLDNQPSSERPSSGRQPWEQDQEGGIQGTGMGGAGVGGSSAWSPWGQDPLPTWHPLQGLAVLGA